MNDLVRGVINVFPVASVDAVADQKRAAHVKVVRPDGAAHHFRTPERAVGQAVLSAGNPVGDARDDGFFFRRDLVGMAQHAFEDFIAHRAAIVQFAKYDKPFEFCAAPEIFRLIAGLFLQSSQPRVVTRANQVVLDHKIVHVLVPGDIGGALHSEKVHAPRISPGDAFGRFGRPGFPDGIDIRIFAILERTQLMMRHAVEHIVNPGVGDAAGRRGQRGRRGRVRRACGATIVQCQQQRQRGQKSS